MLIRLFSSFLLIAFFAWNALAQIVTPGAGIHFNFESLAAAYSDELVLESPDVYRLTSDFTLSEGDTFSHISTDLTTLLLDPGVFVSWEGFVIINPTEPLIITSTDTLNRYSGMDLITTANSEIHNTSFLFGNGIFVRTSSPMFSNCIFANHGHDYRSGALTLSNSNATIFACTFSHNSRAGIASAANGNASPHIEACSLIANNTSNGNFPQINLGVSNQATPGVPIRILDTYIEGLHPMAGGIAITNLLGSGFSNAIIEHCTVVNNRYGIAQLGGNIHGLLMNNFVVDNNIEDNPMTGGSGFNFNGNETNTAVVAGNYIENNLWGVTIQGTAKPSFGRVNDPVDIGENIFGENGNDGLLYALYNNTPDTIWAQNNKWSLDEETEPEAVIFHHPNDNALGWVVFDPVYIETNVQHLAGQIPGFRTFPNPVKAGSPIKIELVNELPGLNPIQYVIKDIRGSEVSRGLLNADSFTVPISLASGLYFLGLELQTGFEFIRLRVD